MTLPIKALPFFPLENNEQDQRTASNFSFSTILFHMFEKEACPHHLAGFWGVDEFYSQMPMVVASQYLIS